MVTSREDMVEYQLRSRGIREPRVLLAMARVPRERFVDPSLLRQAYEDRPLPIPAGQTISQPYIVALMLQAAALHPGDRVLEVGTGSGYAAAVASELAGEVHTIERLASLAREARARLAELGYHRIQVHEGDGSLGWPAGAPYQAILVAAGAPLVPEALQEQLAPGGRLIIPVGNPENQRLLRVTRRPEGGFRREDLGGVRFVPLIGHEGWGR